MDRKSIRRYFEVEFEKRIGRAPIKYLQDKIRRKSWLDSERHLFDDIMTTGMLADAAVRNYLGNFNGFDYYYVRAKANEDYASGTLLRVGDIVRDRIPEKMRAVGVECEIEEVGDREYKNLLKCKLVEYAEEYRDYDIHDCELEHLANLYEILDLLLSRSGSHYTYDDVCKFLGEKIDVLGGIDKNLVLRKVVCSKEDSNGQRD